MHRLVMFVKAKPTKFLAKWIGSDGKPRYRYRELVGPKMHYGEVPGDVFVKTRDAMIPKKYAAFVTLYTPEEYREKGAKLYISPNGNSGYALTKSGDLISIFSKPKSNSIMGLMKEAIKNGAKTLDCIGPFLPQLYASYGFKEYDRLGWDDQYAPPNWDYKKFGRPDVVRMKLEKQVFKSKGEKKKPVLITEEFRKLCLDYVRDVFGDDAVDEVLKQQNRKETQDG